MNVLIVEDEEQAGKKLRRMLKELLPDAFLHGPLEAVAEVVDWIRENPSPDLIFMDIHLADGLSFEIFTQVEVKAPVIFTTAYDQYALRAFKLNSIDYLLKPIEMEELSSAIQKFKNHYAQPALMTTRESVWTANAELRYLSAKSDYENKYKQRFISRTGDKIIAVSTEDIAYAYSENKATWLRSLEGKNYLIDFSLEQLEDLLDPNEFFRLNRQYISRFEAIDKMLNYSNTRMKIKLKHCEDDDIVLSREKTKAFKEWIDR